VSPAGKPGSAGRFVLPPLGGGGGSANRPGERSGIWTSGDPRLSEDASPYHHSFKLFGG
jgi:hypothetical protein